MATNYTIKEKICPMCGKTFECLSRPGCLCESENYKTDKENRPAPCPCPECVRVMAEAGK